MNGPLLTAATYNIHACVGTDRRYDPPRIARVLDELDCDVLGLQEVDDRKPPHDGLTQVAFLEARTGYTTIDGPAIHEQRGCYGNALLTRLPVRSVRRIDLSHSGREPRGAIDADLDGPHGPVRVLVTHLGLRPRERGEQIRRLVDALDARSDPGRPTLLLGDLNEWLPTGPRIRHLKTRFDHGAHARSWPSRWPLLPLDRIYAHPTPRRWTAGVHASALARRASDHLPFRMAAAW
jgi:endonuclease/exonuclease/phosphatase family metal-dependent hydrolase